MMIYFVSTMAAAYCFVTLGSMSTPAHIIGLVAQMALVEKGGRGRGLYVADGGISTIDLKSFEVFECHQ